MPQSHGPDKAPELGTGACNGSQHGTQTPLSGPAHVHLSTQTRVSSHS